jgi:hypothetical protein
MAMVEHINLVSSNVDKTVAFLQTAIPSWHIRGQGSSKKCPRWIHFGDDETYLCIEDRGFGEKSNHETYHHVGVNHIGIVVDDVVALAERMREMDYKEGLHAPDHNSRSRYYFFDHDDFEYEFVEYHDGKEKNDYSDI